MEHPTMMDPALALEEVILDPGHWNLWGQILEKKQNTICICFQNIGGLILQADEGLKLTELQNCTQQQDIDIFSFAKYNICWDLIPKNLQLADRTSAWWETHNGQLHTTNMKSTQSHTNQEAPDW